MKDIEIICQPKTSLKPGSGLFDPPKSIIVLAFKLTVEHTLGIVIKSKFDGRYMLIELPSGLKLDLFMPQPADYYRQFAIRTGSSKYSKDVIATTWKKKGWCSTLDGPEK